MNHHAETIEFTGKKPSKAQILKKVKALADKGHTLIEVYWGENGFTLDKHSASGPWAGFGWLKDISGDDVARELNSGDVSQFMRSHFTIVHIK